MITLYQSHCPAKALASHEQQKKKKMKKYLDATDECLQQRCSFCCLSIRDLDRRLFGLRSLKTYGTVQYCTQASNWLRKYRRHLVKRRERPYVLYLVVLWYSSRTHACMHARMHEHCLCSSYCCSHLLPIPASISNSIQQNQPVVASNRVLVLVLVLVSASLRSTVHSFLQTTPFRLITRIGMSTHHSPASSQ